MNGNGAAVIRKIMLCDRIIIISAHFLLGVFRLKEKARPNLSEK